MMFALDRYARNARLKPALLTVLPAAWTIAAWSPPGELGWGTIWGLFVAAGGTVLLSNMGRDLGKRKEKALHDRFGGRPSERLLSHEHAPNRILLAQRHARLRALLPEVSMPTAEDEMRDPAGAHAVYNACVECLIARTRKNELLLEENISYGFRRNLWGLKPFGIVVTAVATAALGFRIYQDATTGVAVTGSLVLVEGLNVAMLAAWVFWFTAEWVMVPSRAYAARLLEALDTLPEKQEQ